MNTRKIRARETPGMVTIDAGPQGVMVELTGPGAKLFRASRTFRDVVIARASDAGTRAGAPVGQVPIDVLGPRAPIGTFFGEGWC